MDDNTAFYGRIGGGWVELVYDVGFPVIQLRHQVDVIQQMDVLWPGNIEDLAAYIFI